MMKHNIHLLDLLRKLDDNSHIMGKVVPGASTTEYHVIVTLSVCNFALHKTVLQWLYSKKKLFIKSMNQKAIF